MIDNFATFILSNKSSLALAFFACVLTLIYTIQLFLSVEWLNTKLTRYGIMMRLMNWTVFFLVFLLFGEVIPFEDVLIWRATARIALFGLMISEIAFQSTIMWPVLKRNPPWTKDSYRSG